MRDPKSYPAPQRERGHQASRYPWGNPLVKGSPRPHSTPERPQSQRGSPHPQGPPKPQYPRRGLTTSSRHPTPTKRLPCEKPPLRKPLKEEKSDPKGPHRRRQGAAFPLPSFSSPHSPAPPSCRCPQPAAPPLSRSAAPGPPRSRHGAAQRRRRASSRGPAVGQGLRAPEKLIGFSSLGAGESAHGPEGA